MRQADRRHPAIVHARPGDAVGRWGGDEFIIVSGVTGPGAHSEFERIQQWVAGRYTVDGPRGKTKVHIDLSVGIAEWRPGVSAKAIVDQADHAMYAAKRRSR